MTRVEKRRLAAALKLSSEVAFRAAVEAMLTGPVYAKHKPHPRKAEKRLTRKEMVAKVRPLVEARAAGSCECGCGTRFGAFGDTAEWDEFHGRRHISVEETWFLARRCHQAKTANFPSRRYWDNIFASHCRRMGYPPPRPRLTKEIR